MTEKAAPSRFVVLRLLGTVLGCVALVLVSAGSVDAQVPGPNVNMVSGTKLPDGDPFLQRQNEPSIAVSTRNPCHLLAGANDYRTVELPGLPEDKETGDAWLGVFKSFDCGRTWKSTLIAGFPQDASVEGLASPLKGLGAGADPIVRAGTNGLFYYSGIAFNRGNHEASKAFVARFIDNNLDFDADGRRVDPIVYLGTSVIGQGTSGQFIDKPSIAVDIPRNGGTCPVAGQDLPAGTVYAVYSTFVGKTANNTTRLMLSQSTDCGATWSAPSKISEGVHTNQGAIAAVAPNGNVYVAWRQFAYEDQPHAIVIVRSVDFGRTFSKPVTIAAIAPFDQNTSDASFRTNAYPTMAIDGSGRVYVAWAARGFAAGHTDPVTGDARIVMSTSTDGGASWSQPAAVDNPPYDPAAGHHYDNSGHQIMPALTFAAGRLQLIYYDLRDDQTYMDYQDAEGGYDAAGHRKLAGDRAEQDGLGAADIFWQWIADMKPNGGKLKRRHNVDVRGMQAGPGDAPFSGATSWRISQYPFGITVDRDTKQAVIRQVGFNPPNLPLYAQGSSPFLGDYIDVAGLAFVPSNGGWAFNTDPAGPQVFHAVWTDNRDVQPPTGNKKWSDYTPPGSSKCDPANPTTGLRNANIYTSAIAPRLVVTSPLNARGLKEEIPAAFPVVVDNRTADPRWYRLQIVTPPSDVTASFVEATIKEHTLPVGELYVQVAGMSSAARTVFVASPRTDAQVTVDVREVPARDTQPLPGADGTTLLLNADRTNPAIMNPDIMNPAIMNQVFNPDIMNPDIMNPDIMNPDIMNPDVMNPAIMNPDIMNPDIMNPAIMNPDIMNPDIMNPDVMNPAIMNPTLANPDIMNPDIMNWDLTNTVLTDMTWTVKNRGNTAGAYSMKLILNQLPPSSFKTQLIVHKKYVTPAVGATCGIASQTQEQVIANILNPPLQSATTGTFTRSKAMVGLAGSIEPDFGDVTFVLGPGEEAKVTLRVADPIKTDNAEVTLPDGQTISVDAQFDPITEPPTPQVEAQAVNVVEGTPEPAPPIVVGSSSVTFVQQPTVVTAGLTFPLPVQVKVTDPAGAVVPGVTVTLVLAQNPGNATLTGAVATTDNAGIATFAGLTVSAPGVGYQLEATAASAYTRLSDLFDVASPSLPGATLKQLAADTNPEFATLPMNVGTPIDAPNGAGDYFFQADSSALFYRPAGPHAATRLLQTGDPAPGFAGSVTDVVGGVKINSSGDGCFQVNFYLADAMRTAVLGYDGQHFRTIAYSDDLAPGGGGARFERGLVIAGFNDLGDTAFSAPLAPPRTPARTTFFLAPASGPIVRLVGMGDTVPGGGATFGQISHQGFNNAGDLLFRATIVGGSGGAGLFVASRTGVVRKIVADGDSYSGVTFSFPLIGNVPTARLNGSGQVAFVFGNVVYVAMPDTGLSIAVPANTPVPSPVQGTISSISPALLAFNDRGDLAFTGNVTLSGGGTKSAMLEIPSATGNVEIVTYGGAPAPGIAGHSIAGFEWGSNVSGGPSPLTFNNVGTAAFAAQLDDGSVVLYTRLVGGTPTLIAQGGQAIASLGGSVVIDPSYFHFYDNGAVYFESFLTGGTAYYGSFLVTDSGTTVLGSTADALPPDARVTLRNLFMGAAGDYVAYNAGRAGGANAIYMQSIGGVPVKVVADGDPAPGPGSGRLVIQDLSGRVPVNASGTVVFEAYGKGSTSRVAYAWTPGLGARRVAGAGDVVPGTTDTFAAVSTAANRSGTSVLNDGGQVLFSGSWYPPMSSSKTGLFIDTPGAGPVKIVATGDPVPGGGTFSSFPSSGRVMNASGQAAFYAYISSGPGIFVAGGGLPLTSIVRIGDTVAGGSVTAIGSAGPLVFDDACNVIFSAALSGGPAAGGLFLASVSGGTVTVAPIALSGQSAPGGGTYNLSATSIDVRMNNAGDILFIAPLTGTSAGSGLFLRRAGATTVEAIVREGDAAPGTTGTFGAMSTSLNSIPGESLALGPTAEVMFFNAVNVGSTQLYGWFRYRLDGTLEKILMRGEMLPGCTGVTVVALGQGAGIGSAGRFSFRVATLGAEYRDMIYTTALASDPPQGCLVARSLSPAPVVAQPAAAATVQTPATPKAVSATDGRVRR